MLRAVAVPLDAPSPRLLEDTDSRRGIPKASARRSHSNDNAAMYRSNRTVPDPWCQLDKRPRNTNRRSFTITSSSRS